MHVYFSPEFDEHRRVTANEGISDRVPMTHKLFKDALAERDSDYDTDDGEDLWLKHVREQRDDGVPDCILTTKPQVN